MFLPPMVHPFKHLSIDPGIWSNLLKIIFCTSDVIGYTNYVKVISRQRMRAKTPVFKITLVYSRDLLVYHKVFPW